MTIKNSDRLVKEKEYQKANSCPTSVCCGVHRIVNQKKYESCSHCKVCPKYIAYKRLGRKDFGDVRFHYVKSFRECELYKMDMPAEKETAPVLNTAYQKTKPMSKQQAKVQLAAEAYIRLEKNHPELLLYVVWSELFAVFVLDDIMKMMDAEVRKSPMFKRENKKEYNTFWFKYKSYINSIKAQCFVDGDYTVVEHFVKDISIEFVKFRISIENYINKFKVENSFLMSHIIMAVNVLNEVNQIHRENIYNIRLREPNSKICEITDPSPLIKPLNLVLSRFGRHEGEPNKINLNDDINIVNGIRVLHNKIRNQNIITEIIYQITEFNKNKEKE